MRESARAQWGEGSSPIMSGWRVGLAPPSNGCAGEHRRTNMTRRIGARALVAAAAIVAAGPAAVRAAESTVHHVHITTSSPLEGVRWYGQHFGCKPIDDRSD